MNWSKAKFNLLNDNESKEIEKYKTNNPSKTQTETNSNTKTKDDTLLNYMEHNGGRCYLHDKSPAEEIYERFKVSKKVFKKAVGDLYKRRLIEITDHGLQLIN